MQKNVKCDMWGGCLKIKQGFAFDNVNIFDLTE